MSNAIIGQISTMQRNKVNRSPVAISYWTHVQDHLFIDELVCNIVQRLLYIKSKNRIKKNKTPLNAFGIYSESADEFFRLLKENITTIPDKTRFQLCVRVSDHWFLVDCYIENQILHTFTLDAALMSHVHSDVFDALIKYFPAPRSGKHYTLLKRDIKDQENQKNEPNNPEVYKINYIQYSPNICPLFTLEHTFVISKMDPAELYNALEKGCDTYYSDDPNTNVPNRIKGISIRSIFTRQEKTEALAILTPLFRCMEAGKRLKAMPEKLKQQTIYKRGNFEPWMEDNFIDDNTNFAIHRKNQKFYTTLQTDTDKSKKLMYPDALGFAQVGHLIGPLLLEKNSTQELIQIIKDLITTLEHQAPKQTKRKILFFRLKALHLKKTKETIQNLKDLIEDENSSEADKATLLAKNFSDIVYNFAGYLKAQNSDRTWKILQEFFDGLEKNLQDQNLLKC